MTDRATPDSALLKADLATSETTRAAANVTADVEGLTRYPGGKNGAGVWQRLINQMPPHRVYIEAFLGSGAILRRKRPAAENVGIDVDAGVIAAHAAGGRTDLYLWIGDALEYLRSFVATTSPEQQRDTLIYCDPPYLGSARSRPERALYRHEMLGETEHAELLRILTSTAAMVMISGYASTLYDTTLGGWRRIEYWAMTRGGVKPEVVWMNYPEPTELHDYRFLGTDFHDRCRLRRKIARWTRKLQGLPALERAAVIAALGVAAGGNEHQ